VGPRYECTTARFSGYGANDGMMDFNFDSMDIDDYNPPVPPQPPTADGNQDAAWYDTDL